jgi:periplasmic protein TonB
MSATLDPVSSADFPAAAAHSALAIGPFERVNSLGRRARTSLLWSTVIAVCLHVWGATGATLSTFEIDEFAHNVQAHVADRLNAAVTIEEQAPPPPPPPPPEPEPEPEPEPKEVLPPPDLPPDPAQPDAPEPPPAAAEAAQVLTAPADPNTPLDLTGEGFLSGTGTRFAGGVTASSGTSKTAVRNTGARGDGVQGAKGTDPEAKLVDKSRPAGLPLNANWNSCPFPAEADAEQINQAAVRVVVVVNVDGDPTSVNVLSDPGFGFARQAQRCAMRFKYPVGLDKAGKPIARATKPFRITFTR